ncbi:MAG: hypothetical protein AB1349_06890 [Elusimicrobiota bacterium]
MNRVKPKRLSAENRITGFEEVEKTLLPHQAVAEASRCLFCHDAPCNKKCPAGIDIVNFIRKIKTNTAVGKDISAEELISNYDAVFISAGLIIPVKLNIPSEDLGGVIQAQDFLASVN